MPPSFIPLHPAAPWISRPLQVCLAAAAPRMRRLLLLLVRPLGTYLLCSQVVCSLACWLVSLISVALPDATSV